MPWKIGSTMMALMQNLSNSEILVPGLAVLLSYSHTQEKY